MNEENKIGIIGMGFVGQILRRYYPYTKWYDPKDSESNLEAVFKCKYIFIAFNLVDNALGSYDEVSRYLSLMNDGTVVIIKSTFAPGITDKLQEEHPNLNVVYNPEFLTEATAWEDFTNPQFQILGMPHKTLDLANELFELLPPAPVRRIISPKDAEVLKHAQNTYYALKVTWFNQLYDACNKIGSDYETVREILVQNPWVGNSHSMIFHKGYRGYGGKCLSKDPKALYIVTDMPIIKLMEEYNDSLTRHAD